jgi:prepilin-type N-terminal cleavage/methylation domain-containing protein
MNVRHNRSGFSLIELVIVVVIIGIIAAIAIPRLSRGSAGAGDSAVSGDLAVLRSAIDLYATEHGGTYPLAGGTFTSQMTEYTDSNGSFSATKVGNAIYGPYLRSIPTLPVGANKGQTGVADATTATQGAAGNGWFYNNTTGAINTNCGAAEADTTTKLYNNY